MSGNLEAAIGELTSQILELRVEVSSLQPGVPRSSPTPATLGKQTLHRLNRYNANVQIDGSLFPDSQDPFLNSSQMEELTAKQFENESEVVKWFEPHFRSLMEQISDELGYKVILVNSERHPWTEDPRGGASSKPDGVAIAVELASFNMTDGDKKYANQSDTNFGAPADWVLRDSLEFVSEWTVDGSLSVALGEGIEYHRRIVSDFRFDSNVRETKNVTDLLIANRSRFMLVRCEGNQAQFIYNGSWDSPCSNEALRRFVLGTLWENAPRERPWKAALQFICNKLDVELVIPTDGNDCFLGYGACGRVFRVQRTKEGASNAELALKVALDQQVQSLRVELAIASENRRALQEANATIQILGSYHKPSKGFSGLLVGPIGKPLRPLRRHIKAALISLKRLHKAGLIHGDSRWENAIMVEENGERKCLWIDLRTLEVPDDQDERETGFSKDVSTLFDSFHSGKRCLAIRELSVAYLGDDRKLDDLLEGMKPVWEKKDSAGPASFVTPSPEGTLPA